MDSATFNYLQGYLPDSALNIVADYALRDDAPLRLWSATLAGQASRAADAVSTYAAPYYTGPIQAVADAMLPLLDRIAQAVYNAPDVAVLLFVLVLLVVFIQVLALLRRLLAWWTRLVFRLLFWSGLVLLAAAAWQRGLAKTAEDAAAVVGRLMGYAAFVKDIWQAEYRKYQQQQVQAQAAVHSQNNGAGGGYSYQYQQQQARGGWGR